MNDQTLKELKAKVETAEDIKKKINALDETIQSCKAPAGFLQIIINYNNQNQLSLGEAFGPKTLNAHFKDHIAQAAEKLKADLEKEYENLK